MPASPGSRAAGRLVRESFKMDVINFAEHDADGNMALDFNEFYAMQPKAILDKYSPDEIRSWFDSADRDGNGTLCVNEYFLWTLEKAWTAHGPSALRYAFERYDKDKTGSLDALEFERACVQLGFGEYAQSIFKVLDADGSGMVSYSELVDALKSDVPQDSAVKSMISTLILDASHAATAEAARPASIDTSGWVIRAHTVSGVRAELQRLLRASGARVGERLLPPSPAFSRLLPPSPAFSHLLFCFSPRCARRRAPSHI